MSYGNVLEWLESEQATDGQLHELYAAIGSAIYPDDEWRGSKPWHLVVDDETFNVRFKGQAQLDVIERLRVWLEHTVADSLDTVGKLSTGDVVGNIKAIASLLDPDVLVGLGVVLTGKDDEWVREHFDLEWIVGGAEMAYKANRVIQRVVGAFFTSGG